MMGTMTWPTMAAILNICRTATDPISFVAVAVTGSCEANQ